LNPTDEGGNGSEPQSTSQQTLAPKATVSETTQTVSQPTPAESEKKTDDVAAAFDDLFNN
jgi:hypothetical protein